MGNCCAISIAGAGAVGAGVAGAVGAGAGVVVAGCCFNVNVYSPETGAPTPAAGAGYAPAVNGAPAAGNGGAAEAGNGGAAENGGGEAAGEAPAGEAPAVVPVPGEAPAAGAEGAPAVPVPGEAPAAVPVPGEAPVAVPVPGEAPAEGIVRAENRPKEPNVCHCGSHVRFEQTIPNNTNPGKSRPNVIPAPVQKCGVPEGAPACGEVRMARETDQNIWKNIVLQFLAADLAFKLRELIVTYVVPMLIVLNKH